MLPNTLAYQQNYIKSIRRDFRQRKVSLVRNLQCREKCMTACADLIAELPSMGLICFTNEFNQHKPQPHLLYSTHSSPSPLHFSHPCGSWSPAATHNQRAWKRHDGNTHSMYAFKPLFPQWFSDIKKLNKVTRQKVWRAWRMCEHVWSSVLQKVLDIIAALFKARFTNSPMFRCYSPSNHTVCTFSAVMTLE